MKQVLILIIGIVLGNYLAEYTTIYRMSCDTKKYGWQWINQKRFSEEKFYCKDSNQLVQRETSLYMISQTIFVLAN